MLALLAAHLVLTALPGVAAALVAARLGVKVVPVLLAIGLAATGVLAMLDFWAYYGNRTLGETYSYFVLFGSVLAIVWALFGGGVDRSLLRQLATPLALWILASTFLVYLGFLHGGSELPIAMSASRFYGPLPADNDIPHYFADWFYTYGHHGHPTFAEDWLASDRPLLQTGYVLQQRLFGGGETGLSYQVLGVVLQQLWVVGLWALLLAAGVGGRTRGLAMLTVLVSDVAIVNGFFVWPKMLPAALLLAAAALILTPLWPQLRRNAWIGALVGALFALAMLAHGGSAFGVIPLAVVAAWRGLPSWRWLGVALLSGFLLFAPWSAYQKWGEPPGNRLLKYQLAGVVEVDDRGTVETLVDSYREIGIGGAIHNKGQNFITMTGGGPMVEHVELAVEAVGDGDLETALRQLQTNLFYNLLPSLGLLLLAPFAMLAAWRRRRRLDPDEWSLALTCFAVVAVGAVAWGLIMFGDEASRTILHQGSFLLPLLAFCGCVCGLRAAFPRFATWYVAISAALMLAIYVPALEPLPGTAYSPLAALLAAAALAGFAALALRAADPPSAPSGAVSPPAAGS